MAKAKAKNKDENSGMNTRKILDDSVYFNPISLARNRYVRDIADFARMEGKMEKSQQFAIKLLMMNEPIDKIIYLTELSREQINELMTQLPKS